MNVVGSENVALKLSLISDGVLVARAFEIATPELRNGPELPFSDSHHAMRDECICVRAQEFLIESTTWSFRRSPWPGSLLRFRFGFLFSFAEP